MDVNELQLLVEQKSVIQELGEGCDTTMVKLIIRICITKNSCWMTLYKLRQCIKRTAMDICDSYFCYAYE
jgi:hypothetical protein